MNDIIDFLSDLYEKALPLFYSESVVLEHKSRNDILSEADLRLNDFFCKNIAKAYPGCSVIAEESKASGLDDGETFVVDPLDGTCNYSLGIPLCGIQIAFFDKGECVASFIGLPHFKTKYYAIKGRGAFRGGTRLAVNPAISCMDGIVELSDLYTINDDIGMKEQLLLIQKMQNRFMKTRLFGAACIDFVNLIENRCQAYICYYRHLWDIAPGLLLASEAGALYRRINGAPYYYGSHSLVVANCEENLRTVIDAANSIL